MTEKDQLMTTLETDALQEIMNIAFGQAAADLSEVINLHVTLTVPHIDLLDYQKIVPVIQREISDSSGVSMVKQYFSGCFSGSSVLIFPLGDGKKLLQMFDETTAGPSDSGYDIDMLEKEALIEISSIIMGACISKITQLLGDVVSFSPPRFYTQDLIQKTLQGEFAVQDSLAIFFKTVFHFQDFDASGCLFLICDATTLDWIKKAIEGYLQQYD
jgi:chemotaxis protein CheC